jgi:phosphoribosyl-AMP cyclohydrolase
VSAPTDNGHAGDKAFFLALENCTQGNTRPLPEVIARLAYNEQGLVPAVTQDARTGEVLMLAWMNREALERTLASGQMTYFSRSRNELWIKGQTSGHFQRVVEVRIDCDGDALLCRVIQDGSACHTGRKNCFYLEADPAGHLVYVDNSSCSCDTEQTAHHEI